MSNSLSFSLVSTVFNEAQRLAQTIADIEAQSLLPDEIVITDAGSTDGTWQMLQAWQQRSAVPIVLLHEKGCNVARGRNLAIAHATHSIIASTDFGCRFTPKWLESIVLPFKKNDIEVVGGAFTVLHHEVNSLPTQADYVLQNGYPVVMDAHFSASSRSIAYRRAVWEQIGGYPEWLSLAADDTVFWRQIKQHNFKYLLVNEPNVFWLRHSNLRGFAREAFRYGLGDGESGINARNTLSHIAEMSMRYELFISILALPFILNFSIFFVFLPLLFLPGLRSYKRAYKNWKSLPQNFDFKVLLYSFWMIENLRWAYLNGYFKGYFKAKPNQKAARKNLGVQ